MAEDTQDTPVQGQQASDPPSKALWKTLYDAQAYTNSYDDFVKKYSDSKSQQDLYDVLHKSEAYTNTFDDFASKYFTTSSERPSSYPLKQEGFQVNINQGEPMGKLPIDLHPSQGQTEQQEPEAPSIENNFGFNPVDQKPASESTANVAPKQSLEKVDFDINHEKRVREREDFNNRAIDNATAKSLKLKGINAQPGSVQYNQERNEFVKQVGNGNATPSVKNGEVGLSRTTGIVENLKKGWYEATTGADEAAAFANDMTDEQRVEYVNKKQSEEIPSAYVGERPTLLGSTGHLVGSSAPFLGKAIIAGAVGGPIGLPKLFAFVATAPEMVNQGAQQEIMRRYEILKREHPERPDVENMKEAGSGDLIGRIGGIAEDAALMGTGMKTPIMAESKSLIGQTVNKIVNSGVHLGAVSAGITAAEQEIGNLQGVKTSQADIFKNSLESFKEGATTGAALTALMHVPQMPKILKSVFKNVLVKNENPQTITNVLQANENVGNIPPGTTQKVTADLNGYREALSKTIDGLSPEAQASIAGLIQKRTALENEAKTKDKTAQPVYKTQTDAIDRQISDIQRTGKPFEHEIDEATGKPYEQPTYDDVAQQRVEDLADRISKGKKVTEPEDLRTQQNFPKELEGQLKKISSEEAKANEGKENPNTEAVDNVEKYLKDNTDEVSRETKELNNDNNKPVAEPVNKPIENDGEANNLSSFKKSKEKEANDLINEIKTLRDKDGTIPDENMNRFRILRDKLNSLKTQALDQTTFHEMLDKANNGDKEAQDFLNDNRIRWEEQPKEEQKRTTATGVNKPIPENEVKPQDVSNPALKDVDEKRLKELYKKKFNKQDFTPDEQKEFTDLANKKNQFKRKQALDNPFSDAVNVNGEWKYNNGDYGDQSHGLLYRGDNNEATIANRFGGKLLIIKKLNNETGEWETTHNSEHKSLDDALKEFEKHKQPIVDEINAKYDNSKSQPEVKDNSAEPKAEQPSTVIPKESTKQEKINGLIDQIHALDKQPRNKKGRIQAVNEIKVKANELGLTYDDKRVMGLYNQNGKKVQKKTGGNSAIIEDYVPLANREEGTKGFVGSLFDAAKRDGVDAADYFPAIKDTDGRRMTKSQIKKAISDVQNDKPTAGAQALLNSIDNFHKDGNVDVSTAQFGQQHSITPKEYLENFKEPLSDSQIGERYEEVGEKQFDEIYEDLKNHINETGENNSGNQQHVGESAGRNAPEAGDGIQRIKEAGQRVAEAQSEHDRATADLNNAEKKLSSKQSKQGDLLNPSNNVVQKDAFANDADVVKDALEPLRNKVKETKAALDKAKLEIDNANEAIQPEINLNKSEERIALQQIKKADAEKIVKDEGLTPENIKDHEGLFSGFPYTPEDLKNIKESFNENRRPSTESKADGQENTGDAGNKKTGDETKAAETEIKNTETGGESAFKTKTKIATTLEEAKGKPISVHDIANFISETFGVPIRKGMIRTKGALGIYKVVPEVIRRKNTNDIGVLTHETAHHVDKLYLQKNFPNNTLKELKDLDYDQIKRRPFEGFAEFVRKWMTGDGDLTKEAPNFLDYWENDLLKNNKELGEQMHQIKKYVDIWRQQGAMARVLSNIDKSHKNPKEVSEFGRMTDIKTKQIDSNTPLKDLVDKVLELKNISRKEYESDPTWKGKDPFLVAGVVAKTAGAKARSWVLDGPTDFAGNVIGKSLKEVIEPVNTDIDHAMAYVMSLRRLDRAKRGHEYTKNDLEDYQYIVDQFKNNKEFNTFAKEITDFARLPIDYMVESGAISRELAQKVIDSDAFYVPLRSLTEASDVQKPGKVKGIANTGRTIGRFGDHGGKTVDPIESVIHNVERMIQVADKSRVVHALLDITDGVDGIGKIIEKVPAPMQSMRGSIESIKTQLEKAGADLSEADMDSFLTIYSAGGKTNNLPSNVIALYRHGKLNYYQVDPVLYSSFAGLDNSTIQFLHTPLGKSLVLATKGLRVGSTGARAGFQLLSNPFRDLFTGIMQTQGRAIDVPLDNIKALRTIAKGAKGSDIMRRYKASGVEMATPLGADRRNTQNLVNEAISDPARRKAMNIAMHPVEAIGKVYDAYIEAISFPESIPRVAEYKKIFKKYDKLIEEAKAEGDLKKVKELENARQVDASNAANEVTLNFKKAGTQAAIINQLAFGYNPAIRGLAKMESSFTSSMGKTLTRGIMAITAPSIALYLLHKDEDWYKNQQDWEKHGFFHFKVGDKIIRLPKPFEWGWAFSTLPETLLQSYDDKDLSHITEGFISGTTVLPSVPIPDVIKPAVQVYFDWDLFRDRSITPKSEEDLLPELQYSRYTSPTAKKLGHILGVSPRKIDFMISGYTGGMGSEILNALPKEYKEPTDLPVVGRLFVRKSSFVQNGQYTQDFYDDYNRATKLKKSQNQILSGKKDNVLNLSKEDQYLLNNKPAIGKIATQLSLLRKQYSKVEQSSLPKELKEKTLDSIANAQYLAVKYYLDKKKKYFDNEN